MIDQTGGDRGAVNEKEKVVGFRRRMGEKKKKLSRCQPGARQK